MKKYHIKLSASERSELAAIASKQRIAAQKKLRAQVLLATDEGERGPALTDKAITVYLPVSLRTIEHLREWSRRLDPPVGLLWQW